MDILVRCQIKENVTNSRCLRKKDDLNSSCCSYKFPFIKNMSEEFEIIMFYFHLPLQELTRDGNKTLGKQTVGICKKSGV